MSCAETKTSQRKLASSPPTGTQTKVSEERDHRSEANTRNRGSLCQGYKDMVLEAIAALEDVGRGGLALHLQRAGCGVWGCLAACQQRVGDRALPEGAHLPGWEGRGVQLGFNTKLRLSTHPHLTPQANHQSTRPAASLFAGSCPPLQGPSRQGRGRGSRGGSPRTDRGSPGAGSRHPRGWSASAPPTRSAAAAAPGRGPRPASGPVLRMAGGRTQ